MEIITDHDIYNNMLPKHNPYGDGESSNYIKNVTDVFLSAITADPDYYLQSYIKTQIKQMNSNFEFNRLNVFFDFYKINSYDYCWDGNLDIAEREQMLSLRENERSEANE